MTAHRAAPPPVGIFDCRSHLQAELSRLLPELAAVVDQLRRRGRGKDVDALVGLAVDDGEAEGLLLMARSRRAVRAPHAALWDRRAGAALGAARAGAAATRAAALAARFRFPPGHIRRTWERAAAAGALSLEAVAAASRTVGAEQMSALAQRLALPYTRAQLVVPERVNRELDLALAWVKHHATVLDTWGYGRRVALRRGLTVLFTGPPGTGKTMAAQVLARELDVDSQLGQRHDAEGTTGATPRPA